MTDSAQKRSALSGLLTANGRTRVAPPTLLPAAPYFDLAGEEFARRLLLTTGRDGADYCLRPDFTLPIVADYLAGPAAGAPAALSYLGPVFRQRADGPAEFDQAGIELLAQPDPDAALSNVFGFVADALSIYGVTGATIRLGGVSLFETFLAGLDLSPVWRARIRQRFGHTEALTALLDRLADPAPVDGDRWPADRAALTDAIAARMLETGLSENAGRSPAEIAARMLEKRELAERRPSNTALWNMRAFMDTNGPVERAFPTVETLANAAGIDLAAPLATLRDAATELAGRGFAVSFDAAFSPRLDYYTGLVFEATGPSGAVLASGGQYDRLLQRLGAKQKITAAGAAVWVDRLAGEGSK